MHCITTNTFLLKKDLYWDSHVATLLGMTVQKWGRFPRRYAPRNDRKVGNVIARE